jgi:membrane associated rhomboid family serine protease
MLVVYLVTAAGASLASFALSEGPLVVGASGAIFGLFGILFAASRMHLPMLDRRGRALLSQIGFLIVINIVIGFGLVAVDNIAHIGGLVTGMVLGLALAPGGVQTLSSRWQPGTEQALRASFVGSRTAAGVVTVAILVAFGTMLYIGMQRSFSV